MMQGVQNYSLLVAYQFHWVFRQTMGATFINYHQGQSYFSLMINWCFTLSFSRSIIFWVRAASVLSICFNHCTGKIGTKEEKMNAEAKIACCVRKKKLLCVMAISVHSVSANVWKVCPPPFHTRRSPSPPGSPRPVPHFWDSKTTQQNYQKL